MFKCALFVMEKYKKERRKSKCPQQEGKKEIKMPPAYT